MEDFRASGAFGELGSGLAERSKGGGSLRYVVEESARFAVCGLVVPGVMVFFSYGLEFRV